MGPDIEELNYIISALRTEALACINELDREEIAIREVFLCRAKRISDIRKTLSNPQAGGQTPQSVKPVSTMIRERGKAGVLEYIGECAPTRRP